MRLVDAVLYRVAFTRGGQVAAGTAELALGVLAVGLIRYGRRLYRPTHTVQEDPA